MASLKKQGDAGMRPVQQQEPNKSFLVTGETECVKPVTGTGKSFSDIPVYPSTKFVQPKLSVNTPGDKYEKEADTVADEVVQSTTGNENKLVRKNELTNISPMVQSKGESAGPASESLNRKISSSKGKGSSLDRETQSTMSGKFGVDFSRVKIHANEESATMNNQINARAFTVGNDIYFNKGEYQPGTKEGNHLLAHELTHTVQQKNENHINRKGLGDIPEATRKKMRISRAAPPQSTVDSWLKDYFDAKGPSSGLTVPIEFSTDISNPLIQRGLRQAAHAMRADSEVKVDDPESLPLSLNTILDMELDLSTKGGDNAIYRFVRYMDGKDEKMLIEKKHVIGKPTASATTPGAATFTGIVSVGRIKVEIDAAFGNDKGKVIVDAIQLLPEPIKARVDGVKFSFERTGSAPGGENGDYVASQDTVHIWNNMFSQELRRVGKSTHAIYGVVHELGHVIDQRPLAKPQIELDKLETQKKKLEAKLRTAGTVDALGEEDKETKAAKVKTEKEFVDLDKQIKSVYKQMHSTKSPSGAELGEETESLEADFGKALKADGVKAQTGAKKRNKDIALRKNQESTLSTGITLYGSRTLQEAFAENFSIYILDEDLLKKIRPATHKFFTTAFPKTAKP